MRNAASSQIEASDQTIEDAVQHASLPALMMSMIHMTGDTSLLDGPIRPRHALMLDHEAGLSREEATSIRQSAVEVIRTYLDEGAVSRPPLPESELPRMMAFALAETGFSAEAEGFLLEELALGGSDPRRTRIDPREIARRGDGFRVVIIGAGMSGLLLGFRLAQEGVPFTILEKNSAVGGTWHENRYPGCRVDIASHSYSYSFEGGEWDHYFGEQEEVRRYFESFAQDAKLLERIQFGATVTDARYDEERSCWAVRYESSGELHEIQAAVLVTAVGLLNTPKTPNIGGRDRFRGRQMHTAQWDESVDLAGQRVAVVGTGASAFQLVPAIADTASRVFVFQRRPPWMFPNPQYHDAISDEHQWCLRHLPEYARWYRLLTMWPQFDKAAGDLIMVDPEWDDGGVSCSASNRLMRDELAAYIESQVSDPALRNQVTPDYPPFGTRMLQDNGTWLATIARDDVELVASGVSHLTEHSVVASDGTEVEVDVVIWATGFETGALPAVDLVGRAGARLSEEWDPAPRMYLGLSVPKFPNFFSIMGPNTGVLHSGNIIIVSECQVNYIMDAVRLVVEKYDELECRQATADAYHDRLSSKLEDSVFALVPSYFSNASGEVVVCMPWLLADYWQWTRQIDLKDYDAKVR